MKIFAIGVTALLAALASAAPTPAFEEREFEAQITFIGAADGLFTLSVPTDGHVFYINNPLSVSKIRSEGGATCSFKGIDGSITIVVGAQTVDVGPPQTQVSGSCRAL